MFLFCRRIKSKQKGPLLREEIISAELLVLNFSQRGANLSFMGNSSKLVGGKAVKDDSGKLCPFLNQQGTMRLKRRLKKSIPPDETEHPILLPAKHLATILLLRQGHVDNLHEGTVSMPETYSKNNSG